MLSSLSIPKVFCNSVPLQYGEIGGRAVPPTRITAHDCDAKKQVVGRPIANKQTTDIVHEPRCFQAVLGLPVVLVLLYCGGGGIEFEETRLQLLDFCFMVHWGPGAREEGAPKPTRVPSFAASVGVVKNQKGGST